MSAVKLFKNRPRVMPRAEYVMVTPGQAQTWLDEAGRNRNLSQRVIDRYAEMMRRGDWMMTGQGISFNEHGKLDDGQHRLSAIVQADVPITLLVVRNTPLRSQLVVDSGYKRTPHQQIALREGWEIMPIHIAVAKAMITGMGGPGDEQRQALLTDIQQMDRYYVKHRRAIEFTVEEMWRHKQPGVNGVVVAPVMAPVARAYYTQDNRRLARYCRVVATGMAEDSDDGPAVVLRNWLIGNKEKGISTHGHKTRYILYKKAEIALSAFLRGESIERLGQRHLDRELFPLPDDARWSKAAERLIKVEAPETTNE